MPSARGKRHSPGMADSLVPEDRDHRRRTVLVVDDEQSVRALIAVMLECEGHLVLTAEDGEEALRILGQQHVDLVTLDVMMPGMDGWELGRRLAADPATSGIPRLVVSAAPLSDLEHAPDRALAHAVLSKPFDFATFVDIVEGALGEAAAA